jgi:hypothetical protein
MVVVETDDRRIVIGGDVAVWLGGLDEPRTDGQIRVRALHPELVWLTHEHDPWHGLWHGPHTPVLQVDTKSLRQTQGGSGGLSERWCNWILV